MIETGVLVNAATDEVILWHLPPGRSAGSIPDDVGLWQKIWESRALPLGFAHSHPGGGIPHPSHEDITTFDAIERALGKSLVWWIISKHAMVQVARIERGAIVGALTPSWHVETVSMHSPECMGVEWVLKLWKLSYEEENQHDTAD